MRVATSLLSLFLFIFLFVHLTSSAVNVTIGISVAHPILPSLKSNVTDTMNLMYVGVYASTDTKVQAMKFATQYINNMSNLLPKTRLELYGYNSRGDRAETTSAVFAGYAGYDIYGFIGAESISDSIALQYIAGAYWVPQINPSVVEQRLSDPTDFRSMFSIIPPSSDQQIVILATLKHLGISSALIVSTNNEYGTEMNDMIYNAETLKLNITFRQVSIDTNASDFDQKLTIVKESMHMFRYVIMHCTSVTGLNFLKALGDSGYIGPQYLYIITHQMVSAVRERASTATYLPYFNGAIGVTARYDSDEQFSRDIRTAWSQADTSVYPAASNGGDLMSAWFAFDAIYAYALALDRIQNQNKTIQTISGEDYYNELMKSNFIGATGNITVNVTAARRNGKWDLYNFVAENVSSTSNGTVKPYFRGIGNGVSTDLELIVGQFVFFGGNTTLPPPYIAPPDVLKIHKFNTALSAALGAVLGLAILVAIFATFMLIFHWRSFARHGSFYCTVIITGIYVGLLSAVVLLPEPTDRLCTAFPWLLGIGFVLIYGCLFIKTWALYLVWWNAEKFRKTTITPMTVVRTIGGALVLETVFLIVWTVIDPPQAKLHKMVDGYYMLQCSTDTNVFWGVFAGIKGFWLIFGALLSVVCRRVMREFNHSKSIAYSIYNIFVLLVIGIPLAITLEDVPGGRIIIEFAVIVIAFTFTIVSLFFGVWYRVFVPEDETNVTISSHSSAGIRTVSFSHSKSSNSQERDEDASRSGRERGISMSPVSP